MTKDINAGEEKLEKSLNAPNVSISHTVEAEIDLGENLNEYGKFKDLNGLLNAYNSLQSEFTRRCQRIKELERENGLIKQQIKNNQNSLSSRVGEEAENVSAKLNQTVNADSLGASNLPVGDDDESLNKCSNAQSDKFDYTYVLNAVNSMPDIKNQIIREYLNRVNSSKPTVKLISGDGSAVVAPPSKPKDLAEAGQIARQIFEKQKEKFNL